MRGGSTTKEMIHALDFVEENVTIITLLNSLAEGVVMINEKGIIVFVNERIAKLTGYEKEEMTGQSLNLILPEQFTAKHDHHLKSYFNEPRIRPMGKGLNLLAKRKDGSIFPIEISLSHLDTVSGKLGVAFLTDITLRKKAEDELEIRNKELDQYAHTVAHDINSLLGGIIGFSEVLISNWGNNTKDTELSYLERIAKNGKKINEIVKELLFFASLKKEDIEKTPVNMRTVIDSACDRFKFQIEEKSVQINIEENIFNCTGYAKWIEEVLYNYISNAIKYGGEPPIIDITSEKQENGYIKYNVTDNGEGVPDELIPVIFEEDNSQKNKMIKGNGLGLSIVKRIAEKLDGYVSVESKPGEGSIFSFSLKG